MAEPSTVRRLKRWMDLDWYLHGERKLNIAQFAEDWDVTERTINNDLELFTRLGYRTEYSGYPRPEWHYSAEVPHAMFRENIGRLERRHDPKRKK